MNVQFVLERAIPSDEAFLGECLCYSERAHTGMGIWDVVCEPHTVKVMSMACLENSPHFTLANFLVIRDTTTGQAVAGACGFMYPEFTIEKSKKSIIGALQQLTGRSDAEVDSDWKRIDFLVDSEPDYDQWDGSWVVESVYC